MFVSVNDVINLPGMPGTAPGVRATLNKCAADSDMKRKRQGSKAFEYHIDCLPDATRQAVLDRHYNAVLTAPKSEQLPVVATSRRTAAKSKEALSLIRQCPALLERQTAVLTDKQRSIADSRCALVVEVLRLQQAGMSRVGAIKYLCDQSRARLLPAELQLHADNANARQGSRSGIGSRSLNTWVLDYQQANGGAERLAVMSPGHHKASTPEQIGWLPRFLAHWRSLNGPSLQAAYEAFADEWALDYADQPGMLAVCPSYHAVRRAMNKLPRREKARGRVSGSAARALETYQKRDWSQMPVNGCWVSDGKSLNMKVAHPIHGRPFTPEMTIVIDGRSRYVVGWSLALSENVIAVADAFRYAIQRFGKPLFTYSDNGGGEKNKTLDADITGIFPRQGIDHMTGIPGNPQARGIIERLNGVIPRAVALKFGTYNGLGADRENVRLTSRAIDSAINALDKNKPLNSIQKNALAKLPSWQLLLDVIKDEVEKYNTQHRHSELPKVNGKHMTPAEARRAALAAEGDEIEYLTAIELREMFMPEQVRVAQRGWIELLNNQYFSEELIAVDGEEVRVAYDIHDANSVIVRRMSGVFVCEAIWNGNKQAAIPVTTMQISMDKRRQRRLGLVDAKRKEIEAEGRPLLEAPQLPAFGELLVPEVQRIEEPDYHFLQVDRDIQSKKNGTHHK